MRAPEAGGRGSRVSPRRDHLTKQFPTEWARAWNAPLRFIAGVEPRGHVGRPDVGEETAIDLRSTVRPVPPCPPMQRVPVNGAALPPEVLQARVKPPARQ